MKKRSTPYRHPGILLVLGLLALLAAGQTSASVLSAVAFEENGGQLPDGARYATRADGFSVVVYPGNPAIRTLRAGRVLEIRIDFGPGARKVEPVAERALPGVVHYYRGSDPADWTRNVKRYAQVRYAEVYPGIDAVLHDRDGRVELDFEVAVDADPELVSLSFEGARGVRVEAGGQLAVDVGGDSFRFSSPEIYQRGESGRELLPGSYKAGSDPNRVDFQIAAYDEARPLVIDPVFLGFSSRIGGSGRDSVRAIATDPAGNLYLTGSTNTTNFAGVMQTTQDHDVFVAKLDAITQNVVYLAFFGGNDFDQAWGLEVDAAGNAYVGGYTRSTSFPTLNGYEDVPVNTDAFAFRLDASGAMSWGTVYGGAQEDGEFDGGIGVHTPSGRFYIASRTNTTNRMGVNEFSDHCPAAPCGFIAGFDPSLSGTAALVYESYVTSPNILDLSEDGGVLDFDVDVNENLYAFGFQSPNSKVVAAGQGFQDASGDLNNNDHYVIKLDPSLAGPAQRIYSTFIGGFGDESERGRIEALDNGLVYVGSKTDSTAATFPIGSALQATNAGGEDGYVFKIDTTLAGVASRLWGTFLGSISNDEINAIAVDAAGNAWVAATVSNNGSNGFPQAFPLVGSGVLGVDDDAAVAQISSDGTSLLFGSPVAAGAISSEQAIAVFPSGRVAVAGSRQDANFPLKAGLPLYAVGDNEIMLLGLDPTPDLGLVLEIDDTKDPAATGDDFAFQYLIKNRGIADAANAILTTDYPAGLSASLASANCSLPGTSATCDFFEDIPEGGNVPVYIVSSAASPGSFTVNGSVTSDLADPSPGDNADSQTTVANALGSFPGNLLLSDFDAVARSSNVGGFSLDTRRGVLATPNGSFGEVVNLMNSGAVLPFQIEELLGQGEIAFGFVDELIWTPADGDGSDLFGRDFNASADRVFAIVDAEGNVELRTARAFNPGRVVATGRVPLGRPGLLSMTLSPTNAQVFFDAQLIAEGDPFTTDFNDALPANVADDFVISVGFGTEDRGAAIISAPEPGGLAMLYSGIGLLCALARRRRH